MNITWIGSPNYTQGREGHKPNKIVIHWMDGTLSSTDNVFQDTVRNTSAHYGVEDNLIHQYVNTDDTAYHAGNWEVNLESIGIEHSADPNRPASDSTYNTSAALINYLANKYTIPLDRDHIIKHSQVISTQCPGSIDLDILITKAKGGAMDLAAEVQKLVDQHNKDFDTYFNRGVREVGNEIGFVYQEGTDTYQYALDIVEKLKAYTDDYSKQVSDLHTQVDDLTKQVEELKNHQAAQLSVEAEIKDIITRLFPHWFS